MIFVCPECGGSGEIPCSFCGEIGSTCKKHHCPQCPCNHKIAIQEIDLDVPDGYEFTGQDSWGKNILIFTKIGNVNMKFYPKLPHKIGDMWECDVCGGRGRRIRTFKIVGNRENLYEEKCPKCKGIKAELIDIQYKDKLVLTWREV